MSKLVRIFLLITVAVLLIEVIAGIISGTTGLVEKVVLLGVGVLLLVVSTQVQLKGAPKRQ
jgi:hypothetical protein